MMKTTLLAAVALLALSSASYAEDLAGTFSQSPTVSVSARVETHLAGSEETPVFDGKAARLTTAEIVPAGGSEWIVQTANSAPAGTITTPALPQPTRETFGGLAGIAPTNSSSEGLTQSYASLPAGFEQGTPEAASMQRIARYDAARQQRQVAAHVAQQAKVNSVSPRG